MKHFWNALTQDGRTVINVDNEIIAEDWFEDGRDSCARNFRETLANSAGSVTIRINSPGGDVFAASDMYAAMMDHDGEIIVEVTGIAASAASVIAMAGDVVRMAPTATMMIHNPWTMAAGSAKDLRHEAKILDEIREGLVNAYEIKTGISRERLKTMLDNETWMNARTALALGFCDEIIGEECGEKEEDVDEKFTKLFQTRNSFERAYAAKLIRDRVEPETESEEKTEPEPEETEAPEAEKTEKETETEETQEEKPDEETGAEDDEESEADDEQEKANAEAARRAMLTAHAQAALERVAAIMGRR